MLVHVRVAVAKSAFVYSALMGVALFTYKL